VLLLRFWVMLCDTVAVLQYAVLVLHDAVAVLWCAVVCCGML
jgi:hypothetical protein